MAASLVLLLVDDNDDLRYPLKECLELNGFIVKEATNGKAALVIAERSTPDLIITDYDMPFMNGVELARHLRKFYPDLPIVFATAGLLEPILSQVENWPRVEVLRKPFALTELIFTINRLLREKPPQE